MGYLKQAWLDFLESEQNENWWTRKKALCAKRDVEIVKVKGRGEIYRRMNHRNTSEIHYLMYLSFLMKQGNHLYMEEVVTPYRIRYIGGNMMEHEKIPVLEEVDGELEKFEPELTRNGQRFSYDRLAAVRYAERWWNSYNPEYRKFDVDCTNYVSQCLRAGGAPMRGAPNRSQGWWYQSNNWSFSWAVAHSLRWYLSGSTQGLQGKEVESPDQLNKGDIICYDFQGDGRWDHNTIVVSHDARGMPLVNAHTDNSRHRYWSYEDSTAWTENIKYKFFQIGV